MLSFSASFLETWQACPHRWYLQSVTPVVPAPQPQLLLGRAVHAAIEVESRQRMAGEAALALDALQALGTQLLEDEAARADPNHLLEDELPVLRLRLAALLQAYQQQVIPRLAKLEAVEEWFRVPLVSAAAGLDVPASESCQFNGRLDARGIDAVDHAPVLVDYKTASRPWRAGSEHTTLQATAYIWAARQLQQVEDPAFLYILLFTHAQAGVSTARVEFRRTRRSLTQLAEFEQLLLQVLKEYEEARAQDLYPAHPGNQCRWCPVAPICTFAPPIFGERGPVHAIPTRPSG